MGLIINGVFGLAASVSLLFTAMAIADVQSDVNFINILSLTEVEVSHPESTLILFDIDDTLFDFPFMVGSRGWRRYLAEEATKIDDTKNWYERFFYYLSKNYPVKTVEPMTKEFVNALQINGLVVCGFTARKRSFWYDEYQEGVDMLTIEQLNSVGIDFNNSFLENTYPRLALNSEYFNGVFFCNYEPKGEFLKHLFEESPELQLPAKVVFIDDKISQVKSVASTLNALGVPHECYCYLATDAKMDSFNPLIANIQFLHFCHTDEIISDEAAAKIAEENPDLNADFYLRAILKVAKDF